MHRKPGLRENPVSLECIVGVTLAVLREVRARKKSPNLERRGV